MGSITIEASPSQLAMAIFRWYVPSLMKSHLTLSCGVPPSSSSHSIRHGLRLGMQVNKELKENCTLVFNTSSKTMG